MSDGQRIDWIDSFKAMGIILVVLGHNFLPEGVIKYIFSFHVPLFFFISGYLFKPQNYSGFISFLRKKVGTILLPYFCFFLISYAFWLLVTRNYIENFYTKPLKPLAGMFYSIGIKSWLQPNIVLWFLTCLFVVEILFYILIRIQNKKYLVAVLVIFSVLGYAAKFFMPFRLPWSADVAFVAVAFYGAAFLLKDKINLWMSRSWTAKALLAAGFMVANLIFMKLNIRVDMNNNIYGNYFYFYLAAFCGIFAWMFVSGLVGNNKILNYIGRNTLIILTCHLIAQNILMVVALFAFKISPEVTQHQILIFIPAQFILLIPTIYIINKYARFLL